MRRLTALAALVAVLPLAAPAARAAACRPAPETDAAHAERAMASTFMLGIGRAGGGAYVVDPRGWLISNDHVAARAKRLRGESGDPDPRLLEVCQGTEACSSTELTPDGRLDPSKLRLYAEVVARDPKADLALLRIVSDRRWPVLPWSKGGGAGGVLAVRTTPDGWGTPAAGRVTAAPRASIPEGHEGMDLASVWMSDVDTLPGYSGAPLLDRCDGGVMGTVFGGKGELASDGETYFSPAADARGLWERSAVAVAAAERRVAAPGYWAGLKARLIADMERALRERPEAPSARPRP